MKLVNVFAFARKCEAEQLLIKLNLEKNEVNEWVAIESNSTFQGKPKTYNLNTLLKIDKRFEPFIDRIKIIETKGNSNPAAQLAVGWGYLHSNYKPEDWILISDTDESLDFSDSERASILMNIFKKYDQPISIPTIRYWWDFDNRFFYPMWLPCKKIKHASAQSIGSRFDNVKKLDRSYGILGFEYSFCYPKLEDVWDKLHNYISQPKCIREEMELALLCNHWYRMYAYKQELNEPLHWFETVELSAKNSPEYVIENLEYLKNNIIDPDYEKNRALIYGDSYKNRTFVFTHEQTKNAVELLKGRK